MYIQYNLVFYFTFLHADLNVSLLVPNDGRTLSKGPADTSSIGSQNSDRQSELLPQKAKFFGKHLYKNVAQVDGTALPIQMATLKREAKEFEETGSDDYTEVMEQRPPVSIPSPYIEPTNLYSSKVENKEESVHCIVPTDVSPVCVCVCVCVLHVFFGT